MSVVFAAKLSFDTTRALQQRLGESDRPGGHRGWQGLLSLFHYNSDIEATLAAETGGPLTERVGLAPFFLSSPGTMPSPKKGLLCNLNHVHLQHISLGLHLSRHPELREETNPSMVSRERTACPDCGDGGDSSELVDANSNHPLLPCRCCDLHPLTPEVKEGLTAQQPLANGWVGKHDNEEEEGPGSPFDPDSSSVSSSSDLSLDDTPVSVYCKPFPSEEVSSPESQPNIVPLDDAQNVHPIPKLDERSLNLNIRMAEQPTSRVWDSPDSLCSISSPQSTPDMASPDKQILPGPVLVGSSRPPPPPPVRPYRAPPAVPVAPAIGPGLDSNCNAVPAREAKPEAFSVGRVDVNSNREPPPRPRFGGVPPPVPPRTKKNLQALRQSKAEKPNQEAVFSTVSDSLRESPREMQVEVTKKNITSFHELAQKRKKATAVPPAPQSRKEQSDWLIVFSPDTEFPPSHEVLWGSAPSQDKASPLVLPAQPANPPACAQSGVTTFKELRYRKQKSSHLAPKGAAQPLQPHEGPPRGNLAPQEGNPAVPPSGHFRGPQEGPPRRKAPRPGLQPIVEGNFEDGEERGGAERKMSSQSAEDLPNGKRDLWLPGKQERGDGSRPSGSSCGPHHHPFHPFLVHFSLVDGQEAPDPFSSSLENVELTSPDRAVPAFFPHLKTLSCEEICLLAGPQGRTTLSPENLLPVRLSPIGAYSPPARSVLPFLESPDLAVLFSPFFPRSKTYPALAFSPRQVPKPPCGAGPGRVTGDKMGDEESGVPKPLRHSQSFGGIPSSRRLRKVDVDRTSTQLREEKKALLVAISASVDKIVAHFSAARNLVQKAQLGDSKLNPDVGYLVLNTLCPALRALVSDGLKPFQKDVITGQRPSSPWSVVEASVKPGPQTRSLNALYWRVSRLAPLRSNQQRFHAFILGLLNTKQLEQWFAHLQRNSELISALYVPTAFLVLSQSFCRRWAEELLLLLQPLSTLTFQLDLLFEHHHLTLEIRPTARQATTPSPTEPVAGSYKPTKVALSQCLASLSGPSSPIQESTLPQRRQENGDRLTRTLLGNAGSPEPNPLLETEDKQRSWWEQLSRASGVYASMAPSVSRSETFPCARWTKLRMAVSEAIKEAKAGVLEAAGGGESGLASASEMGNPPAGEASRKAETNACPVDAQVAEETPDAAGTPGDGKGKRLGWLFGANCPAAPAELDSNLAKPSKRPSSWLPPAMNVLALVMKTGPAEKSLQEGSWEDDGSGDALQFRAVRALCDHAGNGAGHLSFRKGDVLQILDTVNEDWLQCSHGDRQGLVPVGYTSLLV